ncbi:MAG: hypothetical protein ACOVNR_08350 [Chitinophagaceae bacterium]
MKFGSSFNKILVALTISLGAINLHAQINANPQYDSLLAKKLGGNDWGMKNYVFVILKTGKNTTTNQAFKDSCFKSHMHNMDSLVKQGKLIVAGPIAKNDMEYRGIFILNAFNFKEAEVMLKHDGAINQQLLEPLFFTWFGSAALSEYLPYADKIWRSKP